MKKSNFLKIARFLCGATVFLSVCGERTAEVTGRYLALSLMAFYLLTYFGDTGSY